MADQYAENQIKAQVWAYWDSLSVTEKIAAADEYLRIAGYLVPSEMAEDTAARVRADLPKVLIQHPKHLRHLQQTLRR